MKFKVNRLLSQGRYKVNFEVSDFSHEELTKMSSFGIPVIPMKIHTVHGITNVSVGLNAISKAMEASFVNEETAKEYEAEVREKVSQALESLRQRKDDFTSSEEVDI